jgi:hypothetical protein
MTDPLRAARGIVTGCCAGLAISLFIGGAVIATMGLTTAAAWLMFGAAVCGLLAGRGLQ